MDLHQIQELLAFLDEQPDDTDAATSLHTAFESLMISAAGDTARPYIQALEQSIDRHRNRRQWVACANLLEVYAQCVVRDPRHKAALWFEIGRMREELLEPDAARDAYIRCLEHDSDHDAARKAAAELEKKMSEPETFIDRTLKEAAQSKSPSLEATLLGQAASALWSSGERKRAIETFERALKKEPSDVRVTLRLAHVLTKLDEWDEAARYLERCADASRNQDDKLALYLKCARICSRKLKQRQRAATCYRNVLFILPGTSEALRFMVEHLTETEAWDELVVLYEKALGSRQQLDDQKGILLQIGMIYWKMKHAPDEAEPYFARLRSLEPAHPGAVAFYRDHWTSPNDAPQLLTLLSEAQRTAGNAEDRLKLALEAANLAQEHPALTERAIDAWRTVLQLNPSVQEAHDALQELYTRAQKWNALIELRRKQLEAATEASDKVLHLKQIASLYAKQLNNAAAAAQTWQQILTLKPNDLETLHLFQSHLESQKRWAELVASLEQERTLLTTDTSLNSKQTKKKVLDLDFRIGQLWMHKLNNMQKAREALERAWLSHADNAELLAQLKELYTKQRAWDRVAHLIRQQIEQTPSAQVRIEYLEELAHISADKLRLDEEALKIWQEVLALDPHHDHALESAERMASRVGDRAQLVAIYEQVLPHINASQKQIAVLQKMATLYQETLHQPGRAAELWRQVLEREPTHPRAMRALRESYLAAKEWDELYALYEKSGDLGSLFDVFQTAADTTSDKDTKVDLYLRAAALIELTDSDNHKAVRCYERVLEAQPSHPKAQAALIPAYEHIRQWKRLATIVDNLVPDPTEQIPAPPLPDDTLRLCRTVRDGALGEGKDALLVFRFALHIFRSYPEDAPNRKILEHAAIDTHEVAMLVGLYNHYAQQCANEVRVDLRARAIDLASEHLGRPELALDALEATWKDSPTPAIFEVLRNVYHKQHNHAQAVALFAQAVATLGDQIPIDEVLADSAQIKEKHLSDIAGAIDDLQSLHERNPTQIDILLSLERLGRRADRWELVIECLESRSKLSSHPRDATSLMKQIADLRLSKLDQYNEAAALYERVLERDPGDQVALQALEKISTSEQQKAVQGDALRHMDSALLAAYEKQNDTEAIIRCLYRIRGRAQNTDDAQHTTVALIDTLIDHTHRYREAFDLGAQLIGQSPPNASLWDKVWFAAQKCQAEREALTAFTQRLEADKPLHIDHVPFALRIARIHSTVLNALPAAIGYYEDILQVDPLNNEAFVMLKDWYTEREAWMPLQGLFANRIAATSDHEAKTDLSLQLCFLLEEVIDDTELAIRAYRDVLEIDPGSHLARRGLDRLYTRTYRWRDLAGLLDEELRDAEGVEVLVLHYRLGEIYEMHLGDAGAAVEHYRIVIEMQPTHIKAQEGLLRVFAQSSAQREAILTILQPILEAQGAYRDLAVLLETDLKNLAPKQRGEAWLHIAHIYEHQLRDPQKAFDALSQAFDIDPGVAAVAQGFRRLAHVTRQEHIYADKVWRTAQQAAGTPLSISLLQDLGAMWKALKTESVRAETAYREIIRSEDAFPQAAAQAYRELELIHRDRNDFEAVAEDLEAQLKYVTDRPPLDVRLKELATLYENILKRPHDAARMYLALWTAHPEDIALGEKLSHLYETLEEWPAAVDILLQRQKQSLATDVQKRLGLKVADTYQHRLNDIESAIAAYNAIVTQFGPDLYALDQLQKLYASQNRWIDVLETLQQRLTLVTDASEQASLRVRIADIMCREVNQADLAVEQYRDVVRSFPDHAGAQAGLENLLLSTDDLTRREAARILVEHYGRKHDQAGILRALEGLNDTDRPEERLDVLLHTAQVVEKEAGDLQRAFDLVRQATLEITSPAQLEGLLDEFARLAQATDNWSSYVHTLREVGMDISDPLIRAEIFSRIALAARDHLKDFKLAVDFFDRVLELQPDSISALDALCQLREYQQDFVGLLPLLATKAELARVPSERNKVLNQLASVAHQHLKDPPQAIAALWRIVEDTPDPEAIEHLRELLNEIQQWNELSRLHDLELGYAYRNSTDIALDQARLALNAMNAPAEALRWTQQIVESEPTHHEAIALLDEIARKHQDNVDIQKAVLEVRERASTHAQHWPEVIATLEKQQALTEDLFEITQLKLRVANIQEESMERLDLAFDTLQNVIENLVQIESTVAPSLLDRYQRLGKHLERWVDSARVTSVVLEASGWQDPAYIPHAIMAATWCRDKLNDVAHARALLEHVLQLDAAQTRAFEDLEALLIDQHDYEALITLYRHRLDLAMDDDDRIELLRRACRIYDEILNQGPAAIEMYLALLDMVPTDLGARRALCRRLEEAHNWDGWCDQLEALIAQISDEHERALLRYQRCELLVDKLERGEEAIFELSELLKTFSARDKALRKLEHMAPTTPAALEALIQDAALHGEWSRMLSLKVQGLESDVDATADAWLEVSQLYESKVRDMDIAFDFARRAWLMAKERSDLFDRIMELSEYTQNWPKCYETLELGAQGLQSEPEMLCRVFEAMADIRDQHFGDPRAALELLKKILNINPDHPGALDTAETLGTLVSEWPSVVTVLELRAERESDPEARLRLLTRLGRIHHELIGDMASGVRYFEAALEVDPTHVPTLQALETMYTELQSWGQLYPILNTQYEVAKDNETAAAIAEKIARLSDAHPQDFPDGVSWYERWHTLAPKALAPIKSLEITYAKSERWYELVDMLERHLVLEDAPQVAILTRMAEVYRDHLNEFHEAFGAYRRALTLAPTDDHLSDRLQTLVEIAPELTEDIYQALAPIYTTHAQWQKLDKLTAMSVQTAKEGFVSPNLGSPSEQTLIERCIQRIELEKQHTPQAMWASAYQALEMFPESLTLGEYVRAMIFSMTEHAAQRMEKLHALWNLQPALPGLLEDLIETSATAGDWEAHAQWLQRALEAAQDIEHHKALTAQLAQTYEKLQKWVELRRLLEDTLEYNAVGHLLQLSTLAEQRQKDFDAAKDYLMRAHELAPDDKKISALLVDLLERLEQWAELAYTLHGLSDSALESLNSEEATTWLTRLVDIYLHKLSDTHAAIEVLQRIADIDPENLPALHQLSDLLPVDADLETVVRINSKLAESTDTRYARPANLRLIDAHAALGQTQELIAAYRRELALNPANTSALKSLSELLTVDNQIDAVIDVLMWVRQKMGRDTARTHGVWIHAQLGEALENKGLRVQALEEYDLGLQYDPKHIGLLTHVARLAREMQDYERSQRAYRSLLLQPTVATQPSIKADIYTSLGLIAQAMHDVPKAQQMFERALSEEPYHTKALEALRALSE